MSAAAPARSAAPAKQGADRPARERARPDAPAETPVEGPVLSRCACGGGCPRCRGDPLRPKLAINTPGDAFEREADRAADAVMAGRAAAVASAPPPPALRRCACGGTCPSCRRDPEEALRRAEAGGDTAQGFAPPAVHDVLATPGRPLEARTRGWMEERFGADLSGVRVHDDARAADSARAVCAHAYAVGRDLVFAAGRYAPGTAAGDRLLAHEVAHTLQGGAGTLRRQPEGEERREERVGPVLPEERAEPPEPPPNGVTIDLLDPLNSSLRLGGFGLPSPRDVMNGLDRVRRFGQPPPSPANPLPPGWPVPRLTDEELREAACRALPTLCPAAPGTPPPPTLAPLPRLALAPPFLRAPRLVFHARKILDHFIFDETGVPDRHRGELDRTATELIDDPPLVTDITGHTDSHGGPAYNQGLSERRARSIRDYLLDRQVPQLQLWSATGLGESQRRFPGDATDWLAAARNRRVELEIRRLVWNLTLLPFRGLTLGNVPTLSVTDPRDRVLAADRAQFDQLRAFLGTVRGEIATVLGQSPPAEPWAVPGNENVVAMLAVLDALSAALAAERHVVRFDLPTTGTTAASYQPFQDEIHLRPISAGTSLHEVAASLVHEYTHHEQDVTAEELLRAARLPQEHTTEDELRQETESRRNEVYFTRLMSIAGHRVGFHEELSARLFLDDFEEERTGSPREQAAARASIRTTLAGPYAAQLATNAPSRRYLIEIRPDRHAVLVGVGGVETDLGEVPTAITTQERLETHLSNQVFPIRAPLFLGPGGTQLTVLQFVVFDVGRKVAEFGMLP
jgi:hypothetical protein